MRYLEDFTVGERIALGATTVSEEEVIAFGRRFDPQPIHVDPEAAAASSFGGLIASGWHTGAMWMRLYVDAVVNDIAVNFGGTGIDEMRMLRPVRPGDTLTGSAEVVEARRSERKPDRGTFAVRGTLHNQDGELVLSLLTSARIAARPR